MVWKAKSVGTMMVAVKKGRRDTRVAFKPAREEEKKKKKKKKALKPKP